jgi:hypothetical protein
VLSDSHHFRKMLAGVCMIVGPLLLLVVEVVHPELKEEEAAQLGVIADNANSWFAAHLIALPAIALLVVAALGLMHMLREREVAWGHIGGGLALLGLLAFVGIVAIELVAWQMVKGGADAAEMTALLERLNEEPGIVVPLYIVGLVGVVGGFAALAVGLYRARAVQSWMAGFILVGIALFLAENLAYENWLGIVGAAFLLVGLGSIGRMVMQEPDADWEHTPEYKGFRPLAGMR